MNSLHKNSILDDSWWIDDWRIILDQDSYWYWLHKQSNGKFIKSSPFDNLNSCLENAIRFGYLKNKTQ